MEKMCTGYCGLACVDGSCPMANRDEYAERGYDLINGCDECIHYHGCEDCYFYGKDNCEKSSRTLA